ncbi:Rv3235 family protein [Actinosynnema sp. NPDC020468]|uniref:Rv3235 family protein n=1 Tax=Actinosynnema sp. NPDC020468 TaxID=3154488 RepID=UPI0033F8A142
MTALAEVLCGRRTPGQLAAVMTTPALASVRDVATGRAGARVDRVRVCRVSPDAGEVAGSVVLGDRVRAMALRVESDAGHWVCTRFTLLP